MYHRELRLWRTEQRPGYKEMMAEIIINTGLHGFIMLDRVMEVTTSHIVGARSLANAPVYACLESLAQLGAYHIRYITDFSRHVFLMKIVHCSLTPEKVMDGEYVLSGDLLSQSASSFHCRLKAERKRKTVMEGEFLYAAVDYNRNFQGDRFRHHYAKVFSCLQRDIKTD
jgi:hypothetical protein